MTALPLAPATAPADRPAAGRVSLLRVVLRETHYELLKMVRLPAFIVPTLVFPAMFYLLFGVALGRGRSMGDVSVAAYTLTTFGTFGVVGAALFALGAGVAAERGQGWLTVKRASPMPMAAYFAAKVLMSMVVGLAIVLILFALGAGAAHVRLPAATWLALAGTLVLGAAPFCALGCAVGFLAGPNSAPPLLNMIYLPMSFASGLWMPIEILPKAVRAAAPFLPPYHLSRLALGLLDPHAPSALPHVLALAGFLVVFFVVALWAARRDEGKTYG